MEVSGVYFSIPTLGALFLLFGLLLADLCYMLSNNSRFTPLAWLYIVLLWPILLPIGVLGAARNIILKRK
jgi:hypothetical protein